MSSAVPHLNPPPVATGGSPSSPPQPQSAPSEASAVEQLSASSTTSSSTSAAHSRNASSLSPQLLASSSASSAVSSPTWLPLNANAGAGPAGTGLVGAGPATTAATTATVMTGWSAGRGSLPAHHSQQSSSQPQPQQAQMPEQQQLDEEQRRSRQIMDARAALEATMSNSLDREFLPRAAGLHQGQQRLQAQFGRVRTATAATQRVADEMEDLVEGINRELKPFGNLQNWAELLEQRMNALDETLRLAREGDPDDDDGSSTCCSCSDCSRRGGGTRRGSGSRSRSRSGSERGDRARAEPSAAIEAPLAKTADHSDAGKGKAAADERSEEGIVSLPLPLLPLSPHRLQAGSRATSEVNPCYIPLPNDCEDLAESALMDFNKALLKTPSVLADTGEPSIRSTMTPMQRLKAWLGGGG